MAWPFTYSLQPLYVCGVMQGVFARPQPEWAGGVLYYRRPFCVAVEICILCLLLSPQFLVRSLTFHLRILHTVTLSFVILCSHVVKLHIFWLLLSAASHGIVDSHLVALDDSVPFCATGRVCYFFHWN